MHHIYYNLLDILNKSFHRLWTYTEIPIRYCTSDNDLIWDDKRNILNMMKHTSLCCEAYPQFLCNFTLPPLLSVSCWLEPPLKMQSYLAENSRQRHWKWKSDLLNLVYQQQKNHTANTPKRISTSYTAFQIRHDYESPPVTPRICFMPPSPSGSRLRLKMTNENCYHLSITTKGIRDSVKYTWI